ncbi:MAG: hypothetical protein JXB88_06345 [Spirochaetales bacterium]|nr:hypothetical protein [Spirochaetales bacterium]
MINSKIIIGFAGFAVLVSLLAGAISGVPIVEVLLRTLLWAIIFAAIGLGISVVISRYFPDLSQLFNGEHIEEKKYSGDFEAIIPEENPHDSLSTDRMFTDFKEDTEVDLGPQEESSSLEELGAAETSGDLAEETQPEEIIENVASVPYIDDISEETPSQEDDIDNLDTLPEIDSFATSFTPYGEGISQVDDNSPETKSMYSKPKTNLDVHGFVEDPLKTAKAIHTWIERDKEG